MNRSEIRDRFFGELDLGLPLIKGIPLNDSSPKPINKRGIVLVSALVIVISILIVSPTVLLSANAPAGSTRLVVIPEKNGMALRPENADWETRIEIDKGPNKSPVAKVVFGHGSIMSDLLSDWNKESPINRFNKDQPTRLELQRVVSYYSGPYDPEMNIATVFEHTGSFYDHVCNEDFSIQSSFSVVDELNMGDFPGGREGHENDLSLSYRVCIRSIDGEPLDYDFGNPDISLPYIYSYYCATVSYSVSENGVEFYIKEVNKK